MSTGFIILGHGSQVPETVQTLQDVTDLLKRRLQYDNVRYAALQFSNPTLPEAIGSMVGDGATDIIVLPFFLIEGNHMRDDIPEILDEERSRYPDVRISMAGHIGADPLIVDILAGRAKNASGINGQSLDYCSPKISDPSEIEKESFRIIEEAVDLQGVGGNEKEVVKRIIHACGDVSLIDAIDIYEGAVATGIHALQQGCAIIADVRMVATGINKAQSAAHSNEILCKVDDDGVAAEAKATGKTRSAVAMRSLTNHIANSVVVVGNAPTALYELLSIVEEGYEKPALVIGTPVGFVGAAESKEALAQSGLNYITVRGTRGGSAMAVAAINAMLKIANRS